MNEIFDKLAYFHIELAKSSLNMDEYYVLSDKLIEIKNIVRELSHLNK